MKRATLHSCSVFTVSHRFDGFRLFNPARLATRCRPWGFWCFASLLSCRLTSRSCPSKSSPRPWRPRLALLRDEAGASSPPCLQDVHRAPCLLTLRVNPAHRWVWSSRESQGLSPSPGSFSVPPLPKRPSRYSRGLAVPTRASALASARAGQANVDVGPGLPDHHLGSGPPEQIGRAHV